MAQFFDNLQAVRDAIYDEIDGDPDLPNVTNTSSTSAAKLMADAAASLVFQFQELVVRPAIVDFEQAVSDAQNITTARLAADIRAYQDGDVAIVNEDDKITYSTIDSAKQVIDFVSIKQTEDSNGAVAGSLDIKLANATSSGDPQTLDNVSTGTLQGATDYINQIVPPGIVTNVVSENADAVDITVEVFYNPQRGAANVSSDLETAVDNYLRNLPFDGIYRKTRLVDAMQSVPGVVDIDTDAMNVVITGNSITANDPVSHFFEAGYGQRNQFSLLLKIAS